MNSAVSASSAGELTRLVVGGSCNTLKPAVSQEFLLIYFFLNYLKRPVYLVRILVRICTMSCFYLEKEQKGDTKAVCVKISVFNWYLHWVIVIYLS